MLPLIEQAAEFLKGKVRRTPVEFSALLSKTHPVFLKLECLQKTGSFKIRGAYFYLSTLKGTREVAACSAGNHGLGVAYAAKELGMQCTIFVPKNVDLAKYEKMVQLGATVKKSAFIGYDDTLAWAKREATEKNLHMISAFEDEKIMAGNGGSLAIEVLEDVPEATNFVLPVGGGGLAGGFSYYVKAKNPRARIIAAQHADSPALKLSFDRGKAVTEMAPIETVAGGIEGGIGELCFEVLKHRIDQVTLESEEEIAKAFRWMLEHHQYLIEPTAAVALASCLFGKAHLTGPTVVVLTGRNVSYKTVKNLL